MPRRSGAEIGREQLRQRQDVYLFRGDAALDAEAAVWWLQRLPDSVLLFDGVADLAPEIGVLLEACEKVNVRATLVGVERQYRLRKIHNSVPAKYVRDGGLRAMRSLSDTDIASLLATLREHSRLGKLTRWPERDQFRYFAKDSRRQLFSAMADIEGGPGFLDRLTARFTSGELPDEYRDLLCICALTYEFGYALPLGVASHATGLQAQSIADSVSVGPLGDWIDPGLQGLNLRRRYIAYTLVERLLSTAIRYRLSQQLARSLAPLISPSAIFSRSLPYRIVKNLLDTSTVCRWTRDGASRWYAELETSYSWNARYWEQRALTHLSSGDQAAARSFAERAVEIHRDTFTQTTLAHVILRQVRSAVEQGRAFDPAEYRQAVELLTIARDTSRFRDDVPFSVFFTQATRLGRVLTARKESVAEIERDLEEWIGAAEASSLTEYPEYRRVIKAARDAVGKMRFHN